MSEPNPGLPAPAGQPTTASAPEPGQPQNAQNPAPTQPQTPAAPPATPPVDPAKLQKERDDAVAFARQLQSQKDQAEARLRAMAGIAQPPVDPIAAKAKTYAQQFGIHEDDARNILGMMQAEIAPLQQRNQMLEAQVQGSHLAQQAFQKAQQDNPELFADQAIAQATWNALQNAALQGDPRMVTPEYAKYLGAQEWALVHEPWKKATQTPAPQQQFRPAGLPAMSFAGPVAGYPQPQPLPAANAPTAAAQTLAAEMAKYTGVPLVPPPAQP